MIRNLFTKSKKQSIIERVPINKIINAFIRDYPNSYSVDQKQHIVLLEDELTKDMQDIINAQDLPFDLGKVTQVYNVHDTSFRFRSDLGHLILGSDFIFFGRCEYKPGKAIDCNFAFRKDDLITLGSMREVLTTTDDRKVDCEIKKDRFEIELPSRYDLTELFKSVNKSFPPKTYVFFAGYLAGKKLE